MNGEDGQPMKPGIYVMMLGIDGSGKSSVATALRERLEAAGREVVDVGINTMYSVAQSATGPPWDSLRAISDEGWRLYLREPPSQAAILTSGLLELAAHYLIRAEVIGPALERGAVAISDSFCLKNIVRTLRQVQHMTGDLSPAADALLDGVRAALSAAYLQPDIGIFLDADPALTVRWRLAQRGRIDSYEDLTVAGHSGRDAFVKFNAMVAAELRDDAKKWGWEVLPVDGRPLASTVSAALDLVLKYPQPPRI